MSSFSALYSRRIAMENKSSEPSKGRVIHCFNLTSVLSIYILVLISSSFTENRSLPVTVAGYWSLTGSKVINFKRNVKLRERSTHSANRAKKSTPLRETNSLKSLEERGRLSDQFCHCNFII